MGHCRDSAHNCPARAISEGGKGGGDNRKLPLASSLSPFLRKNQVIIYLPGPPLYLRKAQALQ